MAFDKVVDSSKLNAAMKATADKIRAEAKTSDLIEWDESNGFADSINTQTKTATPSTNLQAIRPDAGYVGLSQVNVEAIQPITQATPSISVSSGGLITASATQTAGYVAEGTKSATKQLSTQAAKTVTPSTADQTAVASGKYTTGAITVKGDANLKGENIVSGISIFGVAGTHSSAKVATGTFTGVASGVTITGLGFQPTRVIAYWTGTGTISSSSSVYKLIYFEAGDREFFRTVAGTKAYNTEDVFSVTMNSDGFTLATNNSSSHPVITSTWNYIAIG